MSSIFEHTCESFSEHIFSSLGRGRKQAEALYQHWYKKGLLSNQLPIFANCPQLYEEISTSTDFTLPSCEQLVTSDDTTTKFLLRTHDGYKIESVRIPMKQKDTLCVSSQVGCRMGCVFCETGRMGLLRNLSAKEIVTQVFRAIFTFHFPIRNVVFMGMGEPFDNYDEVLKAATILSDQNGFGIGLSNMTISTSGKIDGILRLADEQKTVVNLAVSLNAPTNLQRTKLMPHNRKEPLERLYDAMKYYNEKTKKQILIAYVLMKGVNDRSEDAQKLLDYLTGLDVKINLIPYNSQRIDRFETSLPETVDFFAKYLRNSGIQVLLRRTKGEKIMAACGQLATACKKDR